MNSILGAIIFIVMVVSAIASKVQESKRASEQRRMESEAARTGGPRASAGPATPPLRIPQKQDPVTVAGAGPPAIPGRQLFDALLGKEPEREWETVAPPVARKELPGQIQPGTAPPSRRPDRPVVTLSGRRGADPARRVAARPVAQQEPVRHDGEEARQRKRAERQAKLEQRRAREAARPLPLKRDAVKGKKKRTVVFGGPSDLRRAIILSEVLGTPRGLDQAP